MDVVVDDDRGVLIALLLPTNTRATTDEKIIRPVASLKLGSKFH